MAHCWRKVKEKLPLRGAESAPSASLRMMTTVELRGGGLQSEDPSLGLPEDLMLHVRRVRKSTDDSLAVAVGPPAEDHTPAVE